MGLCRGDINEIDEPTQRRIGSEGRGDRHEQIVEMAIGIGRTRERFDTRRMGPDIAQGREQDFGLADIAVAQDDQALGREPLGAKRLRSTFTSGTDCSRACSACSTSSRLLAISLLSGVMLDIPPVMRYITLSDQKFRV